MKNKCSYYDYATDAERPLILTSTRSNTNDDAHRDFDEFDVNEELARLRRALREDMTAAVSTFIASATTNIDEWLTRGGGMPDAWRTAARPAHPMARGE
jgi:hypothetical protein